MKQNADILCIPLAYLINCTFETGIFPDKLKIARVTSIFKGGEKSSISNYRPISVLNVFSKIYEKAISARLQNFLLKNEILYSKQFGFQKVYSTTQAICCLTEKISKALDNNKQLQLFLLT